MLSGPYEQFASAVEKVPESETIDALSQFRIVPLTGKRGACNSEAVLRHSASANNCDLRFKHANYGNRKRVSVYLSGYLIADVVSVLKKECTVLACVHSLTYLRAIIKGITSCRGSVEANNSPEEPLDNIKQDFPAKSKKKKKSEAKTAKLNKSLKLQMEKAKISDTNIGHKLLQEHVGNILPDNNEGKLSSNTGVNPPETIVQDFTAKSKNNSQVKTAKLNKQMKSHMEKAISDTNIGHKLLQKMGWVGGGLGREGREGIIEPIMISHMVNREGLGLRAELGSSRGMGKKIKDKTVIIKPFMNEEQVIVHMVPIVYSSTQDSDK